MKEVIKTLGAAVFCGLAVWGAITMVGRSNDIDQHRENVARAFCEMAMVGGASQKCIDNRERMYRRDPNVWATDNADYSDGIMGN